MENSGSQQHITFLEHGKTWQEALQDPLPRETKIRSGKQYKGLTYSGETEVCCFTEREGLENLRQFFATAQAAARHLKNEKLWQDIEEMRTQLVFIGEPELQTALAGMTQHLLKYVAGGKAIFLYEGRGQSERYLTMRLLETLTKEQTQQSIYYSSDASALARAVQVRKSAGQPSKVIALDDFAVTGLMMRYSVERLAAALQESQHGEPGLSVPEVQETLEVDMITFPLNDAVTWNFKEREAEKEYPVSVFAYYSVLMAVTGSHSSTDFYFEDPVLKICSELARHGVVLDPPLLINIRRTYAFEFFEDANGKTDHRFANPQLEKRWERVAWMFGLEK